MKKYFFNWFHICDAHSLGQDLGHFWKPASQQLIKYVHNYLITDFRILAIPEAIFQTKAVKFGSVGALNTLINMSSGFCDNRKILFLLISFIFMHGYLWKIWNR